ncbi:hypothetical protein K437DRAFT_160008 [Tilletiaria anomala UBC 951]|uniref:Carbohydrate-binding module family 13 protein n=1 Tax=Tilletiaria anomala (strain ATCC 24038 / CBS 436.72 / UBC 951) TaxID=1037660 RepID=A0A066VQT0_TILAU|nr:uncharacterized protein K437DRAFT_160008 [Tilletiaria anomala UBC 951]KDN42633.1 hypothetical protein K437DRAFT_160008 [Tilletiaria anomala UBC 951]
MKLSLASVALAALSVPATFAYTYGNQYQNPGNLPAKVDNTQTGYNDCQSRYGNTKQSARCQNLFVNSIKDFCLFGPPSPGQTVGDQEEVVVSYCMKSGYGTRLIPNGAIKGAHFLLTPSFVQVTGVGDLTKINIAQGDEGGELDPHGATGSGNPRGGLVFTRARGNWERMDEWQHFISYNEFCVRACFNSEPYRTQWCPHIYDVMGCYWNEPANYNNGQFEQCDGTQGQWPGVYSGSTWYQGQSPTPPAQAAGSSSNCRQYASISNGVAVSIPSSSAASAKATRRAAFDDDE